MFRNKFFVIIALALIALAMLAACATPAPAQPTSAPPTAASEPTTAAASTTAAAPTTAPAPTADAGGGAFQVPEIEAGKYNVAFIYIGPHDDAGWTQAHDLGL